MNKIFKLTEHDTTIRKEMSAGLLAFITVIYIIAVNATILSEAGIPFEAGIIATILACFAGCAVMALWSNTPIILVPGMGINAMFTYTIVQSGGYTWQEGLAVVFLAGLLFSLVAFTPLAKVIMNAIPDSLKESITVGIGILLMLIGFHQSGIIVKSESTLLALGSLAQPEALVTMIGLVVTFFLFTKNVPGNLLISIVFTTILAAAFGIVDFGAFKWDTPEFSTYTNDVLNALSWESFFSLGFVLTAFSLAMVVIFENVGLIYGHTQSLKQPDKFERAFQANAISVITCGLFGTSPTVSSVESAAGIAAGGKTGLTSMTTGLLFLLSILFIPIIKIIPASSISPVLILIGALMIQNIKNIPLHDLTESFPALLVVILIPLTFSIADGMAIGFIAYPLFKVIMGKAKEIALPLYLIGLLFLVNFVVHYV